jgi:predicted PurR-regulated permease PerM
MGDLLYLISEEGLPTFLVIVFLLGVGIVARWFASYFNANLNSRFNTLDNEIREMQQAINEHNNKVYGIVEKLISNQKDIQQNINALESSNDTLISFIKKNGNGHK